MSTTVAQLLKAKPDSPHHLHRHEERPRLRRHQADGRKGIGALLVVDGDDIAGIVTERDYARKVVLQDRSSKATRVEEIMTAKVRYVEPSQSTDECMALMTEHRMRHLPVSTAASWSASSRSATSSRA